MSELTRYAVMAISLAALVVGTPGVASATLFDFFYEFESGDLLEGSLEGDVVDDVIQNVSDVRASFNGDDLEIVTSMALAGIGQHPAIVSFSGGVMNFYAASAGFPPQASFILCSPAGFCGISDAVVRLDQTAVADDGTLDATRWSILESGSEQTVPEPGTFLLCSVAALWVGSSTYWRRSRV